MWYVRREYLSLPKSSFAAVSLLWLLFAAAWRSTCSSGKLGFRFQV